MDPRERNRLANVYRREAEKHQIGSPYRVDEYVRARIGGKSEQQALLIARRK